jgi:hypothetical protein
LSRNSVTIELDMIMPRFFFQFRESARPEPESFGMEFPDVPTAINEARRTAAEMMRDAAMDGKKLDGTVEVRNADGVVILRVRSVEESI